ncbi:MAG: hypothetical protein ABSF49_16730, partial [Roseiarcus sp.]|uniref:hypothetical protein n=1 Tax=Roseiarcus sp. TaxID=1969460 RepID=UPI003C182DE4
WKKLSRRPHARIYALCAIVIPASWVTHDTQGVSDDRTDKFLTRTNREHKMSASGKKRPSMQFARHFRLSEAAGRGVRCDESGLYVGATPLLERKASPGGRSGWRPRPLADLDRELGEAYRERVAFAGKLPGLATIASALDRGEIARAQIAAVLLGLPDPIEASALKSISDQARNLTSELKRAGILAASVGNDERESSQMEKFNPYHDEDGRFTDAAGAVAASSASATVAARGSVVAGAPSHTNQSASRESSEPAVATTRVATAPRLTCLDAFRACVQDAIFVSGRSTSGCTAALATCKSTGLPTIFPPGILGQR